MQVHINIIEQDLTSGAFDEALNKCFELILNLPDFENNEYHKCLSYIGLINFKKFEAVKENKYIAEAIIALESANNIYKILHNSDNEEYLSAMKAAKHSYSINNIRIQQ